MLKKILTWAAIGFVVYYLATDPHGAAGVVTGALAWLKSAAAALGKFLHDIHTH
ncbi:MAG: hypothetical protein M0030_11515 [Actinomycetota bacterium]|nr:hypothetical protein [Actinomycetota bacterium]